MTKATVNRHCAPLVLGDSPRSLQGRKPDLLRGQQLSWVEAADPSSAEMRQESVIVEFGELLTHEALSRHKALVNVCKTGSEVLVISAPHHRESGFAQGKINAFPLGILEASVSAIKSVLPFEASLVGTEHFVEDRYIFRLALGRRVIPVLDEVSPVPQPFWTDGVFHMHLGKGFYELEHNDESSFSWMGPQGRVLVQSSSVRLVKVELWVEPFIIRPQKLHFGGNQYVLVRKTKVTAYGCMIPGHNPFDLVLEGDVDSPFDRGLSTDSRKLALKIVGGKVSGL